MYVEFLLPLTNKRNPNFALIGVTLGFLFSLSVYLKSRRIANCYSPFRLIIFVLFFEIFLGFFVRVKIFLIIIIKIVGVFKIFNIIIFFI